MATLVLALLVGIGAALGVATLLVGVDPVALGLTAGGYLLGTIYALSLMRRGYPHAVLGRGNLATLARMALVASLLAPIVGLAMPWTFVAVATLALVLDGFDGWLARREGLVSDFGARLDTEVDSALGLILALNVWALGVTGPLILLIGLPRYVFVAASVVVPWLKKPLPDSYSRKVVCVVQLVSLVVLSAQILPSWFVVPVVLGVAAALAWSFGRDILWLWKARP
jgi:phosphatidylglycerophosphate synthase